MIDVPPPRTAGARTDLLCPSPGISGAEEPALTLEQQIRGTELFPSLPRLSAALLLAQPGGFASEAGGITQPHCPERLQGNGERQELVGAAADLQRFICLLGHIWLMDPAVLHGES